MSDKNYYSIADESGVELVGKTLDPRADGIDPSLFDDILKISHSNNVTISSVIVDAGGMQRENAIDMNRECRTVLVQNCKLVSGMQNAITIKGGCEQIIIENVEMVPGRGHADIELGNWSDQSQKRTTKVTLINVRRTDGKPVRLTVGNADYPAIHGSNIEYQWARSWLVKAYVFIRGLRK